MNILLTGSVAYDYLMKFPGYFKDHILTERLETISLSFLVESMVRLRGGVAPNIAYTLALLGERPRLWAAVGEDFDEYRVFLENAGVDTSGARLIPGVYTASFFANTDLANSQIASFYPGAMAYASQLSLKEISSEPPDMVVISPNDPLAMIQYVEECKQLSLPYIYDPSQQIVRLNGEDLRVGIESARALFVNEYEFALIQKMTGLTPESILQDAEFIVVTCGERGAIIYTPEKTYNVTAVRPESIADPTGVGDAFRGGFLKGYCLGLDWESCGRMGALAASFCLECNGPQGHRYTLAGFVRRYTSMYGSAGRLAELAGGGINLDEQIRSTME